MDQPENNSQYKGTIVKRGLIIVLILTNSFFLYKFSQYRSAKENIENKILIGDKRVSKLEKDLENTIIELEKYKELSTELNQLLRKSYDQIAELKEIISNSQTKTENYKLRDRIQELIELTEKYLAQIDSLLKENRLLKHKIDEEKNISQELRDQQETLKQKVSGTRNLAMENVYISGISSLANMAEQRTNIISKINKIKLCFDINESKNEFPEEKEVLIQLINPEGQIITSQRKDTKPTKLYDSKSKISYSTKLHITYDNTKKNFCLYIAKNNQFIKGQYKAKFFCDGELIKSSTFELE